MESIEPSGKFLKIKDKMMKEEQTTPKTILFIDLDRENMKTMAIAVTNAVLEKVRSKPRQTKATAVQFFLIVVVKKVHREMSRRHAS